MATAAALAEELADLDKEEAALNARVDAELEDMEEIQSRVAMVADCVRELGMAAGGIGRLSVKIGETAGRAQGLSQEVRRLDKAQNRVKESLAVATAARQLAKSAAAIEKAMADGDLEAAAEQVSSVMSGLGEDALDVMTTERTPEDLPGDAPRADHEREAVLFRQVLAARAAIRSQALSVVDEGSAGTIGDQGQVLKAVRILALIGDTGPALQGLAAFRSRSIRSQLASARSAAEAAVGEAAKMPWANLVALLLRTTAAAVESDAQLAQDRLGGRRSFLHLISAIHAECFRAAGELSKSYANARQLGKMLGTLAALDKAAEGDGAGQQVDSVLAELDTLATEMSHIINGAATYDGYILGRVARGGATGARSAHANAGEDASVQLGSLSDGMPSAMSSAALAALPAVPLALLSTPQVGAGSVDSGGFHSCVVAFTEADGILLHQSVRRAFTMETPRGTGAAEGLKDQSTKARPVDADTTEPITSSVCDDVFYLFKRALQRAAHTQTFQAVAAASHVIATVLRDEYLPLLQARLRPSTGAGGLLAGVTTNVTSAAATAATAAAAGATAGAGAAGPACPQLLVIGSKLSAAASALGASWEESPTFLMNLNDLNTTIHYLEKLISDQVGR